MRIITPDVPRDLVERVTLVGRSRGSRNSARVSYREGTHRDDDLGAALAVVATYSFVSCDFRGIRIERAREFQIAIEGPTVEAVLDMFSTLEDGLYVPQPLESLAIAS